MSPVTSWVGATTVVATSSGVAWNSLSNAQGTTSGTWANTSLLGSPSYSQQLTFSGYSFTVPAHHTVTGIEVEIRKSHLLGAAPTPPNDRATDHTVCVVLNAVSGTNLANPAVWSFIVDGGLSNTEGGGFTTAYGGKRERWGFSIPTLNQYAPSNLQLTFRCGVNTTTTLEFMAVDYARIRLWYSDNRPWVMVT